MQQSRQSLPLLLIGTIEPVISRAFFVWQTWEGNVRLNAFWAATLTLVTASTSADATSSDLVFCSSQPSKEERLACYEAAAKIAVGQSRTAEARSSKQTTPVSPTRQAAVTSPPAISVAAAESYAKAPALPPSVGPVFSWTGCYVGIHGGGGVMRDSHTDENGGGAIAGGQAGCNYQIGQVVLGLEGEGSWTNLRDSSRVETTVIGVSQSLDNTLSSRWLADAAVRIGFTPADRVLAYAKFGGAVGSFEMASSTIAAGGFSGAIIASGSKQLFGLLWGAGSEFALGANWSAKVEYNYINFLADDVSLATTCAGLFLCGQQTTTISSDQHLVKLGVNYRWTGSYW